MLDLVGISLAFINCQCTLSLQETHMIILIQEANSAFIKGNSVGMPIHFLFVLVRLCFLI